MVPCATCIAYEKLSKTQKQEQQPSNLFIEPVRLQELAPNCFTSNSTPFTRILLLLLESYFFYSIPTPLTPLTSYLEFASNPTPLPFL